MKKEYVPFNRFEKPTEDTYNTASLILTNYCNLNCPFCYNASSSKNCSHMTFEQFKTIVDKLKDDIYHIQLSGGEPFANPYIEKMIDYLLDIDLKFHITTNSTLMNDTLFNKILQSSLASVQLSLDGACPQTDDAVRGPGHFNTVISLMQRFHEHHFDRGLTRMVITAKNYTEVEDYFYLNLKYGFIPSFSFLVRSGRADLNWENIYIDNETIYNIKQLIRSLFDKNEDYFKRFDKPDKPHIARKFKELNLTCVEECQFNLDHYFFSPSIHPNGDVYPCQSLSQSTFIIGNLLSEDPKDIFSSKNPRVIELSNTCKKRKQILDTEVCTDCKLNAHCGKGCVAKSIACGDINGTPDDCDMRKRDHEKRMLELKRQYVSQLLSKRGKC